MLDFGDALTRKVDDLLNHALRDRRGERRANRLVQLRVGLRAQSRFVAHAERVRRGEDHIEAAFERNRTGDEGGDLAFFTRLPLDEFFDVRMIEVDDDHLRGTAGSAAALDCAGRTIADAEE